MTVAGGPGDVPSGRPASLGPGSPAVTSRGGRTTFEWLDGGFFLIQRFSTDQPNAPSGIAIIGAGTEPDTFPQHYYDSRGVTRSYGVISSDGGTTTGAWESTADGQEWNHDFTLTYIAVTAP